MIGMGRVQRTTVRIRSAAWVAALTALDPDNEVKRTRIVRFRPNNILTSSFTALCCASQKACWGHVFSSLVA